MECLQGIDEKPFVQNILQRGDELMVQNLPHLKTASPQSMVQPQTHDDALRLLGTLPETPST